jgi:hypothetical protein
MQTFIHTPSGIGIHNFSVTALESGTWLEDNGAAVFGSAILHIKNFN